MMASFVEETQIWSSKAAPNLIKHSFNKTEKKKKRVGFWIVAADMKDDLHGWLAKAAGRVLERRRQLVRLKDGVIWKDQNQRWCTWRESLCTYWFRVLHERGSTENRAKSRDKEGGENTEENKVGHAEPAESRSGLLPALRLVHLSSFFFA